MFFRILDRLQRLPMLVLAALMGASFGLSAFFALYALGYFA